MNKYNFDWSDLAFGSKKPVNDLKGIFIAAPRELSSARFRELIKENLPVGNIILGIAKEKYVDGFEDQPQFRTLQMGDVEAIIDKVNDSAAPHKIYTLSYFQREANYVLEKLHFKKVVLVNGSWQRSFHLRSEYYTLSRTQTQYELVSPFIDEQEAKAYAKKTEKAAQENFQTFKVNLASYTEPAFMQLAQASAKLSFDHTHQTGVALARKKGGAQYELLATAYNRVVPYQTRAMLLGSEREKHFAPANDLNYYDTVHAETELLITAQKHKLDLGDSSLFINLLPCPTCARMLAETDMAEVIYQEDHSDGYAIKLLAEAGKQVRRLV